ncbi:hypothetical protein NP493_1199g02112 [Ridgeia piscesae]|uniref:Adenosine deaminase n=1 Tax=Ridgeia piscesae TaxID=27915 RepID=A0AAD9KDE8_RIDPI|nr:hypothetical protein NP493_1199g02112 [Ridgeia piscesae]
MLGQHGQVELHVHLDGSFRPETIFELARSKNIDLKVANVAELKETLHIPLDSVASLAVFLDKFPIMIAPIVGDLKAIERVTNEFCEDIASQGIIYCESRYSPHILASNESNKASGEQMTARNVVIAISKVFEEAERRLDVKFRSILCCMRHLPELAEEVLELCTEFRDKGVCGIDMAGHENMIHVDPTPKEIIDVFREAHCRGINITVHAGESGEAANVAEAVDKMHAVRIGHGYHVIDDDALYKRLGTARVHFEVCPCSSVVTGSTKPSRDDHPLKRFIEDGVDYSINSDDPTITGGGLSNDYSFVMERLGVTQQQIFQSNLNATRAAFLPAAEKKALVSRLLKEYTSDGYQLDM